MIADPRSARAQSYRHLYNTGQWDRTRQAQLRAQPLCQRCLAKGFIVAATICDHNDPRSKDSPTTFFAGPFTSLCKPCHDGPKQAEEASGKRNRRIGFSNDIGADGLPLDPRHPFYAG